MVPLLCWQVFQLWTTVKTESKKQIETSPSQTLTFCMQVLQTFKQQAQPWSFLLGQPIKMFLLPIPFPPNTITRRCAVQHAAVDPPMAYVCITIPTGAWWRAKKLHKASPRNGWVKAILSRQRYSCWGRKINIYAALLLTKSLNSEGPHCVEARLWKISLTLYRFLYCPYHWSIQEPFRNTLSHMPNICHVQFILTFIPQELHM